MNNIPQRESGNNRDKALQWIVILTAITMMPQYALQGWLATGGNPSDLPAAAWWLDAIAWSVRALVEAWVLMYLFSTQPKTPNQAKWLTVFEVALISLITLTLGPALYAIGIRQSIAEALPELAYLAWSFGVASYAPLMLGAAGYAWRVEQSEPINNLSTDSQEIEKPIKQLQETINGAVQPARKTLHTCKRCGASTPNPGSHTRYDCPNAPQHILDARKVRNGNTKT